jgi:hypothetical protein
MGNGAQQHAVSARLLPAAAAAAPQCRAMGSAPLLAIQNDADLY